MSMSYGLNGVTVSHSKTRVNKGDYRERFKNNYCNRSCGISAHFLFLIEQCCFVVGIGAVSDAREESNGNDGWRYSSYF